MLYRNNSLLNLITILFSLFFLTILSAESNDFILPKKKIYTSVFDKKKTKNETIEIDSKFESLPKKKPLQKSIKTPSLKNDDLNNLKTIEKKETVNNIFDYNLPQKKPVLNSTDKTLEVNKNDTKKIVNKEINISKNDKKISDIKKIESNKKNPATKTVNKISKINDNFLYPLKKPFTYQASSAKASVKSKILKKKDYLLAKKVFVLIKKSKWNSALSLTKKIKDKEFKNLVNWLYLKETGNQATFNDYQDFISKNSDYPRIGRLRYLAEHKILIQNSSPRAIINWFDNQEPLSGTGKIKLGEAYIKNGENDLAIDLIKSGWINADLSSRDLKYYKKKFKKILSTDDHLKRANYLAWDNQYWDLKRMLPYLPKKERALYYARFIMMTNSYGVDKAISKVPQDLINDLGFQYNRLSWRTKRNRLEGSLEILRKFHGEETLIYPERWWKLRENITRDLIYEKKYSLAYEVSSNHHLTNGPEFAAAEWLSGWLALSFLNKNELAIKHFNNFYNNVGYPISLARCAYWLGLSYEKSGNNEKAKNFYKEGSKFTNTYYGQLSFNKIKSGEDFKLSSNYKVKEGYEKEFNKNKLIKLVKLLKELDKTKFSKDIIKHLASLNTENGSEILAAKLSTEIGRYDYSIQIAKEASYKKRFINIFNYPVVPIPKKIKGKQMPSQHLILAIIRQESEFDSRANSYVGAKGLMQIMPTTAKLVAKNLKTTYNKNLLTTDPTYNIKLGTYYFNSLLDDYDGVYPFAIGAYNAGPNRIKRWIKKYGDPNRGEIDFVNWIELIRFKETRNYVQRVIENINVYKYVLNNGPVKIVNFFKE